MHAVGSFELLLQLLQVQLKAAARLATAIIQHAAESHQAVPQGQDESCVLGELVVEHSQLLGAVLNV